MNKTIKVKRLNHNRLFKKITKLVEQIKLLP